MLKTSRWRIKKRWSPPLATGVLAAVLAPLSALAQVPIVECTGLELPDGTYACTFCDIFIVTNNIFDLLIQIAAVASVLAFIAGGLFLMFGGASPKLLERGKSIIKGTIIGFVIVLTSWVIINTTINILAGSSSPDGFPWPWSEPDCVSSGTSPTTWDECIANGNTPGECTAAGF